MASRFWSSRRRRRLEKCAKPTQARSAGNRTTPASPCSSPLPACAVRTQIPTGRPPPSLRCAHILPLLPSQVFIRMKSDAATPTNHTHPPPNLRLPQQVRALPAHEPGADGVKRLSTLRQAELCIDAVAILWLLRSDCLARRHPLRPPTVPRLKLCRQVTIPLFLVFPDVLL